MDVEVRDAVETDAESLGAIVDLPADVLRNVVHDRTVRLAVAPHRDPGPHADVAAERTTDVERTDADADAERTDTDRAADETADVDAAGEVGEATETDEAAQPTAGETAHPDDAPADESIRGFVAFDVEDGTVHVTQLAGDAAVAERLLAEPVRFAVNEGFDVALVVPESDREITSAAEAAGFELVGPGPRFGGEPTTKYRFSTE
ncbi:hypothetical protein [Halobellus salinisoli]|uniref:hypothetical protein n=1 Tax=Halobellus salinisoli TaxID=3108500 RepID=UPI00300BE36C